MHLLTWGMCPSYKHCLVLLGAVDEYTWWGFGGSMQRAAVAAVLEQLRRLAPHLFVYEGLERIFAAAR